MYFRNNTLQKAWLFEFPKNPVLKHIWTVNMLKRRKHCPHLHGRRFVIFFGHPEGAAFPKLLS